MGARHAFLRAGFGFGNMPRFMVEDDIASRKLRVIRVQLPSNLRPIMAMRAVYRNDAPPGPAGRWLIDHLSGSSRKNLSSSDDRRQSQSRLILDVTIHNKQAI
jgi:DNA-binding transcriptional LysR family regulator